MKYIKSFFKWIGMLIVTVLFFVFCNVIFLNTAINNTVFNADYYDQLIYQTEFVEEVRQRVINNKTNQYIDNYQGDLEKGVVAEIIEGALLETFPNHWFKDNLIIYAYDIVEFGQTHSDGFFSNIKIKDEMINYRKNLAKIIQGKIPDLSIEEIIAHTDEIEMASTIPNVINFTELLEENLTPVTMNQIMKIPEYRDSLMIGIYLAAGIFALLYYFLVGMAGTFGWGGLTMMFSGGMFIYAKFEYFELLLGRFLSNYKISESFATFLLEKSTYNILKTPGIFIIVGLILLVLGILIEPKKPKEEKNEKPAEEISPLAKEEVIEVELEPKPAQKEAVDPFTESPPNEETKQETNEEKKEEFDFYQNIEKYVDSEKNE